MRMNKWYLLALKVGNVVFEKSCGCVHAQCMLQKSYVVVLC